MISPDRKEVARYNAFQILLLRNLELLEQSKNTVKALQDINQYRQLHNYANVTN